MSVTGMAFDELEHRIACARKAYPQGASLGALLAELVEAWTAKVHGSHAHYKSELLDVATVAMRLYMDDVIAEEMPMSTGREVGKEPKPSKHEMNQPASVGRIVHYQAYGTPGGEFKSVARAAVVTDVHDGGEVTLCVLNPSGIFFNRVKYSEEPTPGCWNWPPHVTARAVEVE